MMFYFKNICDDSLQSKNKTCEKILFYFSKNTSANCEIQ